MMAPRPKQVIPQDIDLGFDDLDAMKAPPGGAVRPPFIHEQTPLPLEHPSPPQATPPRSGRVKENAVATTIYLLPDDHLRLRMKALKSGRSFQTLIMDAVDAMLAQESEAPLTRWETRRKVR